MRKTVLIIALVIIVAAGLYLGRAYIFKLPAGTAPAPEPTPVATPLPTTETPEPVTEPAVLPLSDTKMFDYWVDPSDRTVYFSTADGQIFRLPAGGAAEQLFDSGIPAVSMILPAPRGPLAILEGGYPDQPFFSVINPVTRTRQFLPTGAEAAAWSPDATQIAFFKDQTLNIFTLATGKSALLTKLNIADALLAWKNPKEILFGSRPGAGIPGSWWAYTISSKLVRQVTQELPGLTAGWLSDGKRGLAFMNQTEKNQAGLYVLSISSSAMTNLHTVTIPDKCAFDSETLYCGEPLKTDETRLPDWYYQRNYTVDNVSAIELVPYPKKTILFAGNLSASSFDVYHPMKVGSALYFLNRYDSRLYSLAIN